ncbi:hypothetical protein ACMFMG_002358 [Clarireedia jacksonii]
MESILTENSSLTEVGSQTTELLNKLRRINLPYDEKADWIRALFSAQADRFELWAVNVGLFDDGHQSLDHRLEDSESLKGTLHKFITDLSRAITEALEYYQEDEPTTIQESYSTTQSAADEFQMSCFDGDQDSNVDSDLDLLLDSIKEPIDCLYKLSPKIRNSSRFGLAKAQTYQQIDETTSVDLFSTFECYDYDYISSLVLQYHEDIYYKLTTPDTKLMIPPGEVGYKAGTINQGDFVALLISRYPLSLPENIKNYLRRFSKANTQRRRQFAYWRDHQPDLSQYTSAFGKVLDISEVAMQDTSHLEPHTETVSLSGKSAAKNRSNIHSVHANMMEHLVTAEHRFYSSKKWNLDAYMVRFPDPPRPESTEGFYQCPLCFKYYPVDVLKRDSWRAHFIHDMRPYICTYEDCNSPEELYATREDWITHENSVHRKLWRCSEHPGQTYHELERYRIHLDLKHSDLTSEAALKAMIASSESTLTLTDRCCPFCSREPETMTEMHDHLALHLERIALFSLPRSLYMFSDIEEFDSIEANQDTIEFKYDLAEVDFTFNVDEETREKQEKDISTTGIGKLSTSGEEAADEPIRLSSREELTVANLAKMTTSLDDTVEDHYRARKLVARVTEKSEEKGKRQIESSTSVEKAGSSWMSSWIAKHSEQPALRDNRELELDNETQIPGSLTVSSKSSYGRGST